MTHAFFKALLFMAAGSLIAAMAGNQDLDRMGGFRRAMPFTFAAFVIGGLALSGVPPFSGFFSKDEIIALMGERGGWHWALYVAGYVGSFLTAIYTWRMIFRAFWGEPVPEARELEQGHLHHAEVPTNPATGEVEDTEVGFPGPEHHIAEESGAMKAAMGALAVLATVGGIVQIPTVTSWLHDFLKPTFEDSKYYETLAPSDSFTFLGLAIGAAVALAGIALAYVIWVRRPGMSAAFQARFAGVHRFFVNKWYFDEALDALFVRPALAVGRFSRQTFERVVIDGVIVGGARGVVSASSAAVRLVQTGYVRSYAAFLIIGVTAVSVYFLLVSR
jgi:NADH-quinone oxidoreductase subunit L